MAYRKDFDLEFLSKVSSSDLEPLVKILTHDPKDNSERFTEELTANEVYKRFAPDHHLYWDLIAGELQCFGGNSLVTIFRGGKGVLYREILIDVCDNQKVNYNEKSDIRVIENHLLAKIFEKAWENMSLTQQKMFLRRCKVSSGVFEKEMFFKLLISILAANTLLGFNLASLILVGLMPSATSIIGGSLAGIIAGRVATGVFLPATVAMSILQLASPAYRVTLPACLLVAVLRKKYELSPEDIIKMEKEKDLIDKLAEKIRTYQQSDKKMMGLYLVAKSAVQEMCSDLTDEDVEIAIFGMNHDSADRVKQLLLRENSLPLNWEESVKYAITICGCDKNTTKIVLKLILEWASLDDNDEISRLFQRYDEIVNVL